MKISAQVVLINPEGLILCVCRKDDFTSMGLIGGKMEDIDKTPEDTAIRETKEETGLDISNLRLIFAIHKDGFMGYTYLADYSGEINHNEPHLVKWLPFHYLLNGSFGKYNRLVKESLTDLGIKFRDGVDMDLLRDDVTKFINEFYGENLKLGSIYFNDRNNINGVMSFEDDEDMEESFDAPDRFINGLRAIGLEHGIYLTINSNYWSK
jgi:hypothetical protein